MLGRTASSGSAGGGVEPLFAASTPNREVSRRFSEAGRSSLGGKPSDLTEENLCTLTSEACKLERSLSRANSEQLER